MADHPDPTRDAQRQMELRADLERSIDELQSIVSVHPAAVEAAAELGQEAREMHERDRRYDVRGWARPAKAMSSLFKLLERRTKLLKNRTELLERRAKALKRRAKPPVENLARTSRQEEELAKIDRKYLDLCAKMDLETAYNNPDQHLAKAISEAVKSGTKATPEGKPTDWPEGKPWLHVPKPWDPDWYLARVASRHLRGRGIVHAASALPRLRLSYSAILAAARDREPLLGILRAAGIAETAVAGFSERLQHVIACRGEALTRGWIASEKPWSEEYATGHIRDALNHQMERGEPGRRETKDLVEALTGAGRANLDHFLLQVVRDLLVSFRGSQSAALSPSLDPPDPPDMSGWVPKKRHAYVECRALPEGHWVNEDWAREHEIAPAVFRDWAQKGMEFGVEYRHTPGTQLEILREAVLEKISGWKARS